MTTLGGVDPERSLAFYRDGLGFPVAPYGTGSHVWFRLEGGLMFALDHRDLLAEDLRAARVHGPGTHFATSGTGSADGSSACCVGHPVSRYTFTSASPSDHFA